MKTIPPEPTDEEVREYARETLQEDGEIEFDADSKVSQGDDNGAYVQAWVWVDFSGTPWDKMEREENES